MYVYKLTEFVVMLLLLTTALLIGTVSNESVNKDTSVSPAPPVQQPHPSPVQNHDLAEHLDLPTKFGDEDDVIESKTASDKKASDSIGLSAAKHG